MPAALKPMATQLIMITRSNSTLKKKTGIVILVGIAARFTTSVTPIAPITNGQKIKWFPDMMTANMVKMVNTQPCNVNAAPSQPNLFFSWLSHQLMNFFHADVLVVCIGWTYKCFTVVSMFNYLTQNSTANNSSFMMPVNNSTDFYQAYRLSKLEILEQGFGFFPILNFKTNTDG